MYSVQPHVCGEKIAALAESTNKYGSTPRVWGKVHPNELPEEAGRFNPTCVGKSNGQIINNETPNGSTPRVWGKEQWYDSLKKLQRFNPTCVGKSDSNTSGIIIFPVQPHVCGEKQNLFLLI